MSSDEMESFGVSHEDMEDIQHLNSAYGKKGRFSKEKAIYGLWADQGSDDDGPASSRRRAKADYSRPVDFISGGIKGGSKEDENASDSDPEQMDEEIIRNIEEADHEEDSKADNLSSAGLPKAFVSASQQKTRTLGTVQESKQGQAGPKQARKGMGMLKTGKPEKAFGSWEKHTKGIGLKLLQKMGYEAGTGLGRDGEGINRPIEVKHRTGRGAVAYYGTERTKQSMEDFPTVDSEEEEEKEFKEELQQWKSTQDGSKRKPKYKYRTAEEVRVSGVKLGSAKGSEEQKRLQMKTNDKTVKVVDMTGPVEKVYHGYDSIHSKYNHPDGQPMVTETVGFLPELLHNVELLADQAESDILHLNRQLEHEQNRVINLRHERETMAKTLKKEREELQRVSEVKEILVQLTDRSHPNSGESLTLDECAVTFHQLQSKFEYEYSLYSLGRLAVPVVFPMLKDTLLGWKLLEDATVEHLNLFSQWKCLLGGSVSDSSSHVPLESNMPVFDRLIWEVWMPLFRATMTKWSPRAPHALISFLEQWSPILPGWISTHLLDVWVYPRLQAEVEQWNPTTDSQPIDHWIHPWLVMMGHRLEPLYAPVRHRLAAALSKWDPSDGSAKTILIPWVGVFSQGSMDAFVIRCIVPKLASCLQNRLIVNPAHQDIEPFRWVMSWRSLVPLSHFADMLDKFFFRSWIAVLTQWLQPSNNPNYEEIIRWYSGWKEQFDEELLNHPQVAGHFSRAVEVMQHMVSHPATSQSANMPYSQAHVADAFDPSTSQAYQRMTAAASVPPVMDFKETVQRKAREAGLSLLPDRMHDSHMLYSVGRCSIYFSHNVVFCRMPGGEFQPVSLDQLLQVAA